MHTEEWVGAAIAEGQSDLATVTDPIPLDSDSALVSFAQNGEDIRLWRALDNVSKGTYVEVGGWHPEKHSVSRLFYGRGWSGLVLEPVAEYAEVFSRARPRDEVLQVAASDRAGFAELNVIQYTGLSSLTPDVARMHAQAGFVVEAREVPSATLSDLLEERQHSEIQFMTIDVEGAEEEVLNGLDLGRFRPWILVIEATVPLSTEPNSSGWESQVLAADYDFAVFDGLNRYYVAHEHQDLLEAVALSPNVLDDFITQEELLLRNESDALRNESDALRNESDALRNERDALLGEREALWSLLEASRVDREAIAADREHYQAALASIQSRLAWRVARKAKNYAKRGSRKLRKEPLSE